MSEPAAAEPSEPKRPPWKSPFAWAFVVGIAFLTVYPKLAGLFLAAPPPLKTLGAWELQLPDGGVFGSAQLRGTVWIASFTRDGCAPSCAPQQQGLGVAMLKNFDTKGAPIKLLSFVIPSADGGIVSSDDARWIRVTGEGTPLSAVVLTGFRDGFTSFAPIDAGTTLDDFAALPVLALVDQDGALRGFWKDDQVGRGNVINAALLLSNHGPKP